MFYGWGRTQLTKQDNYLHEMYLNIGFITHLAIWTAFKNLVIHWGKQQ